MNRITIYASELAACIGQNKYSSISEAIKKVWMRTDSKHYKNAIDNSELKEKQDVHQVIKIVQEQVMELINNESKDSVHLEKKIREVIKDKQGEIENIDQTVKELKSHIQTQRGIRDESDSLDTVEKSENVKIVNRNDKFYKKKIDLGIGEITIGGKMDGMLEDGTLIEMKNRQYRIFNTVPIYEKIQVHAYMYITDKTECKLIQSFNGKNKTTLVKFDPVLWNDVIEKLKCFVKLMNELFINVDLQKNVLSGKHVDLAL